MSTARALSRATDPATSREAAAAVTPHLSKTERAVVHAMHVLGRPATAHEIAIRSGIDLVSVSPRMKPLAERGVVREAGVQRVPGRSSRTLWAVVEAVDFNAPGAA